MTQQRVPFDVFKDLFPVIWYDDPDPTAQALIQILKTTNSEEEVKSWISDNLQNFRPQNREGIISMLFSPIDSEPALDPKPTVPESEQADTTDPQLKALLIFALMKLNQVKEEFSPIIRDAHFNREVRKRFLKDTKSLVSLLESNIKHQQPELYYHPKYKKAFDAFKLYFSDSRAELQKLG